MGRLFQEWKTSRANGGTLRTGDLDRKRPGIHSWFSLKWVLRSSIGILLGKEFHNQIDLMTIKLISHNIFLITLFSEPLTYTINSQGRHQMCHEHFANIFDTGSLLIEAYCDDVFWGLGTIIHCLDGQQVSHSADSWGLFSCQEKI